MRRMSTTEHMKWDLFIRIFHWSLVVCFTAAFISGEYDIEWAHSWLGYMLVLLLLARLVWGVTGSPNARFTTFMYSPAETWRYFRSCLRNQPLHYDSHNPLGALMVFALLAGLLLLTASGLLYEGWGEYEGPLWVLNIPVSDWLGQWSRSLHRALPDGLLVLVVLHITGMVVATLQHKENFARAMITGYTKRRD